jgi:DNA-binding NarL/FixJ family response regulator
MKGLSERAIAAEVGCSQKTVNLRKSAIFKILLKKLEGWF